MAAPLPILTFSPLAILFFKDAFFPNSYWFKWDGFNPLSPSVTFHEQTHLQEMRGGPGAETLFLRSLFSLPHLEALFPLLCRALLSKEANLEVITDCDIREVQGKWSLYLFHCARKSPSIQRQFLNPASWMYWNDKVISWISFQSHCKKKKKSLCKNVHEIAWSRIWVGQMSLTWN